MLKTLEDYIWCLLMSAVRRVTEAPPGENIAQHGDGSSWRRMGGTGRVSR